MNREKSSRVELAELIIYCAVMWAATHPTQVGELRDHLETRYRTAVNAVHHRLSVWETLAHIRALPEV